MKKLVSTSTPRTTPRMPRATTHQSCPGVRRRRDSQPSIHLPRAVNLPGMKIAGSALSRFDLGAKKSSLASDGPAADPRRREVGEPGETRDAMIAGYLTGGVVFGALHDRSIFLRQVAGQAGAGAAAAGPPRPARPDDRDQVRRGLRRVVHRRRQQRGAADRHHEEYGVRAGRATNRSASRNPSRCVWPITSSPATPG